MSIVGSTGCGKPMALNPLAGFALPSSADVSVDGRAVGAPRVERGVVVDLST